MVASESTSSQTQLLVELGKGLVDKHFEFLDNLRTELAEDEKEKKKKNLQYVCFSQVKNEEKGELIKRPVSGLRYYQIANEEEEDCVLFLSATLQDSSLTTKPVDDVCRILSELQPERKFHVKGLRVYVD